MIIDYDGKPQDSILYVSALLYKHLRMHGYNSEKTYDYFVENINPNPLLFYFSMDWLYLAGKIDNKDGNIVLCD